MPRTPLKVGQIRTVNYVNIGHRKWRAIAYVRTFENKRIKVQGTGSTKDEALAILEEHVQLRIFESKTAALSGDTPLIELLKLTLQAMRDGTVGNKKLRVQSVNTYERCLPLFTGKQGDRAIGNLPIAECNKTLITNWLMTLSQRVPSSAKFAKVMLSRAYDLTVIQGVTVWPMNPTHGVRLHTGHDEEGDTEPVALSLPEIQRIWTNVQAWQTDRKRVDLVGIVGACMATGFRPAEVLALQWSDIDLSAMPKATATLSGTIVRQDGHLIRQGYTKTKAGYRTVKLPNWFRDMLRERVINADSFLVFPNANGGILDPGNVRNKFREARGNEFDYVKLKSFRSSVATAIENVSGVEEAARQLGHASPVITGRHYVAKSADAGDHTDVLELFAPSK